jgi:hypothetical protein
MKKIFLTLSLILLPIVSNAAGVPTSFTYQGKALNAAGTAPLTSTVSFTLSITDPSSACVLYQESQPNVNLATTNGIFALQIGSLVGSPKRVSGTDPGLSMTTIFANAGTQLVGSSGSCAGYTPSANDVRKLHVVITPSAGSPITVSPDLTINAVPNALVAETLQGSPLTSIYTPAGAIVSFLSACPTGYILANGQSLTTAAYPNLFANLGYTFGGSGANFTLPSMQGYFLRGLDTTGTVDPNGASRVLGSVEAQGTAVNGLIDTGHNHPIYSQYGGAYGNGGGGSPGLLANISSNNLQNLSIGTGYAALAGDSETRPKNIAVNYCLKY